MSSCRHVNMSTCHHHVINIQYFVFHMSDKLNNNLRTYRYVPQTNIQTLSNPAGAVLIMGGSINKHKYYLGFSILLVLARCRLPIYIHNLLEWAKQARHKLENSLGGSWIHYTYGHNMTCKGCQWMTEYWLGCTRSRYYQACIAVSVYRCGRVLPPQHRSRHLNNNNNNNSSSSGGTTALGSVSVLRRMSAPAWAG